MRKPVLIAAALVTLAAASTVAGAYWKAQRDIQASVRTLKHEVTKDFPDPESARFRAVRLQTPEGLIVERMKLINATFLWRATPSEVLATFRYEPEHLELCGEVNAKNVLGAYVGYRPFYARGKEAPVAFIDSREDDFATRQCDYSKDAVLYSEADPG